jgi:YidC/Oxa1 family membrane protein insertase
MLIQLPIWIALFQSIRQALAATPADLLSLSSHLYGWGVVNQTVPMDSNFLWLNLALPDPYIILPILVGVTMWVQQKMTTQPNPDPSQKKANTMMQIMFPLLFAFIAYSFPSGLGVYFVVSAIVGITIQYFVMGWGGFSRSKPVTTTYKQARKQVEEKVIDGKVAEYMSDDEGESGEGETSSYWGKKKEPPQTQVQRKGRKDGRIRSRRKNRR